MPEGLAVYTAEGVKTIPVSSTRTPRERVLDEFHDAITGTRPALHGGPWALASLELCLATMESARLGREVVLAHQVPVPRAGA